MTRRTHAADQPQQTASPECEPTEIEPDYRFTLANERTFLAWQRTALGLLAAAIALNQFVPELVVPRAPHILAAVFGGLAVFTAGTGLHRWREVDLAMRRNAPLPRHRTTGGLGAGLILVGLVITTLVIVKAATG